MPRFTLPARWIRLPLLALAVLCLSNCAGVYYNGLSGMTQYMDGHGTPSGSRIMPSRQPVDNVSWWRGDGASGSSHIVISLNEQKAFFYKGGQLVGLSALSTGDEQHPTPTGKYTITQKSQWHKSSQYGDYVDGSGNVIQENVDRHTDPVPPGARFDGARMDYFMRFTRGIGLHAGYLPGYPASHGCVRMPGHMAQAFFSNVSVGTPVEVRY